MKKNFFLTLVILVGNSTCMSSLLASELPQVKISSEIATSFLEAFMNANCEIKKSSNGTFHVVFQNWFNPATIYQLSPEEINRIMCASRGHIVNDWKTKIVPAWEEFIQSPFKVKDEQKYLAILYLYKSFIEGYRLQDQPSGPRSRELRAVRKEYQNSLQALDIEKFNTCNRFRLHPDGYTFFIDRHKSYLPSEGY